VSEVKRVKKVKKAKPTTDGKWQSRSGSLALSNRSAGIAENGHLVLVGLVWEQRKTDFDLDVVEGGRARGSFAPDKRESVSTLIKNPPPSAPAPPIMPPVDGYLPLDKANFPASLADDVSPEKAAFMPDSQVQ